MSNGPAAVFLYIVQLVRAVVREFIDDGCLRSAAALTYTSLFAVVPFMTVTYAVFSVLPAFEGIGDQIEVFVFENFVPASGAVVHEQLRMFSAQARGLTFAGVVILVITAYMTLVTIEQAFNQIWRVPRPRAGLRRLLIYWTMMTFGPPMVGITILVSSYVLSLPLISGAGVVNIRDSLISWLPWLTSAAAFFVLFWAMPNCRVVVRHALIGALVTMVAFQGAIGLFREVVSNSSMQVIYGTFAAVPLFLSWLYLCWTLVLGGAVLVRQLGVPMQAGHSSRPALELALQVLGRLHRAHASGAVTHHRDLVAGGGAVDMDAWRLVTERLRDQQYLVEVDTDEYVLGRDLRKATLFDLYRLFPDRAQHSDLSGLPEARQRLELMFGRLRDDLAISLDELYVTQESTSHETERSPSGVGRAGAINTGLDGGVRVIGS